MALKKMISLSKLKSGYTQYVDYGDTRTTLGMDNGEFEIRTYIGQRKIRMNKTRSYNKAVSYFKQHVKQFFK